MSQPSVSSSRPLAPESLTSRRFSVPFETRVLLAICGVGLLLRLWPLGGFSTEYDEGVYWQSLRAMAEGHHLFSQVFSSQPPFFLLSLYPFYALLGQSLVAARAGVLLLSLVGLVAVYFAGRAIGGRWAGFVACAVLALDPLYLQQSHTLEAEMPSLVFQLVSVACAAEAWRRSGRARRWLALASGIALGLAIQAKLFGVVALVPAALYLAAPVFGATLDGETGAVRMPARDQLRAGITAAAPELALFAGGCLAAVALLLVPYLGDLGALYDQVVRFHLAAASAVNAGMRHNLSVLAGTGQLYPAGLLAIGACVLAWRQRKWHLAPLALWLLVSLLVLLRQQPLFPHHLVLLSAPLALLAGMLAPLLLTDRLATGSRAARGGTLTSALAGLVALVLLVFVVLDVRASAAAAVSVPPEVARTALALDVGTTPGDVVVADDQYLAALADRDVPPQLVDTSQVRIASGYLTAPQLEAILARDDVRMVLFASGRFDAVPGFRAWVAMHYTQQITLSSGAVLYIKVPQTPLPA